MDKLKEGGQYYIYKTTNIITNKYYIGQHYTSADDGYLGSGKWIRASIKKHGKENFKREIIECCLDKTVDEREIYWIAELSACNPDIGYNLSKGGGHKYSQIKDWKWYYNKTTMEQRIIYKGEITPYGFCLGMGPKTEKQKQELRDIHKKLNLTFIYNRDLDIEKKINKNSTLPNGFVWGRRPASDEFKWRQSEIKSGISWNEQHGDKKANEIRQKLIKYLTGKPCKEETKEILSNKRQNMMFIWNPDTDEATLISKDLQIPDGWVSGERPKTKEHLQKISKSMTGMKRTPEEKEKNRESHKNRIHIFNQETGNEKTIHKSEIIPDGWIRGRNKKLVDILKNKIWIKDVIKNIEQRINKNDPIPDGWIRGRCEYNKKHSI